jgi:glycosyltransferase involved in cell wall biosynthesis
MGVKLKKKYPTKIKLVYDAHEIFGYMIKGNVPGIVTKYAFYMEKKLLKYVDHVITTSDRFAEYFRTITDKPVSIVLNCATLIDVEPKFRNKLFTVIYTGSLEKDRMFPEVVDRLVLIPDIRIIIIARTENMDMYDRVQNILFKVVSKADIQLLSDLPYNYTMEYVMESDCVLSQLDPLKEIFSYALSTKQFDAMLCGKPVICTKGTYSGELTEKLGSGLVVDYTPDAVADAVTKLKDNPVLCKKLGDNGLHYARMEYNWDKQKDVLLRIYGEKI